MGDLRQILYRLSAIQTRPSFAYAHLDRDRLRQKQCPSKAVCIDTSSWTVRPKRLPSSGLVHAANIGSSPLTRRSFERWPLHGDPPAQTRPSTTQCTSSVCPYGRPSYAVRCILLTASKMRGMLHHSLSITNCCSPPPNLPLRPPGARHCHSMSRQFSSNEHHSFGPCERHGPVRTAAPLIGHDSSAGVASGLLDKRLPASVLEQRRTFQSSQCVRCRGSSAHS